MAMAYVKQAGECNVKEANWKVGSLQVFLFEPAIGTQHKVSATA